MLRLRSGLPIFWVSPTTLQFGVQSPVARIRVTDEEALALAMLRNGISQHELEVRCGRQRAGEFLAVLRDSLEPSPPDVRIRVSGSIPLAGSVQALVKASGFAAGKQPANLFVSVTAWELGEREWQRALSRETPLLSIVVGDRSVEIGPLWIPGETACRRCARPSHPEILPLADEHKGALQLGPFEHAAVMGAIAHTLGAFASATLPPAITTVSRGTGSIANEDTRVRPGCPCVIDDPLGGDLVGPYPSRTPGIERDAFEQRPTKLSA